MTMTRFYRARIVLEDVTSTPHESGYPTEHTSTIAEITVSGHSPLVAIERAAPHLTELGANYRDRVITRAGIHGVVPAGAFDGLLPPVPGVERGGPQYPKATGGILKNPGAYLVGEGTMPFQTGEDTP